MTKKQEQMEDQPRGRLYVGFNERWDASHPDEKVPPQVEQLFDPDDDEAEGV